MFEQFPVFHEYVLLRKLYIFALIEYERVLLLDLDGVVTGSLRFLFESAMRCGADVAPPTADGARCRTVDEEVCAPAGEIAEVLVQQTSGTPVLTAYMMVRPDATVWKAVAHDLSANCGGTAVCDRKRVAQLGWGGATGTSVNAPHDWATRRRSPTKAETKLTWLSMGAGFSDQGFVEYFFALRRRRALLVSKWSCAKRLHYLHFNVPPKPWTCPSLDCPLSVDTDHLRLKSNWDSPPETLAWGGHHCARDWWWQYTLARSLLRRPKLSCVDQCAAELDLAMQMRRDASYQNYTPSLRCAHLWDLR